MRRQGPGRLVWLAVPCVALRRGPTPDDVVELERVFEGRAAPGEHRGCPPGLRALAVGGAVELTPEYAVGEAARDVVLRGDLLSVVLVGC